MNRFTTMVWLINQFYFCLFVCLFVCSLFILFYYWKLRTLVYFDESFIICVFCKYRLSVCGLSSHSLDTFLQREVFHFSNVQKDIYIYIHIHTRTHTHIYLFIYLGCIILSYGPGPRRWVENLPGFQVLGFPSEEPVLPRGQSPESDPSRRLAQGCLFEKER